MVNQSLETLQEGNGKINNEAQFDRKFQGREAILSSQISLYIMEEKPKIPDGGWGWWVVFSAFTLNVISEGVCFTFGLLYIEFLDEFGASKSATSWIGSLFMAIPLLAGPLGSALVDKYGCRLMTILGGVICTVGFFFSAFTHSLGLMYFWFGIIGGIGRCLTYVTCVVAIAFWFEKKRSVALGLAQSGAGIGTIAFAPLSTLLINEYRWRGTVLVLASLFFNMCVCGMLMRDPDWITNQGKHEKAKNKYIKDKKTAAKNNSPTSKLKALKKMIKNGEDIQQVSPNNASMEHSEQDRFSSMVHLPTYLHKEKVPMEVLKQLSENKKLYNYIVSTDSNLVPGTSSSDETLSISTNPSNVHSDHLHKLKEAGAPVFPKIIEDELDGTENAEKGTPLLQKNAQGQAVNEKTHYHSYLNNLRYKRNSIGHKGAMLNIHKYKISASSCPDIYRNSMVELSREKEKWYDEFVGILKDLTHFSLFLELHFLLLSLSTINLFIWFIVPYFYLAEHMLKIGYTEEQASTALSVIGLTNTIGMVGLGWAGDRLNVAITYAICLVLCGFSVLSMMYFTENFTLLMINCGLFGLFFASCFSLSPSLLATLVPLDKFTMAYGLGLLCEGIGNLTGPPLAGLLFDITQTWELSFYQAGFWIILSGVLVLIIPFTKNRRIIGSAPLLNDEIKREETHFCVR